MTPDRLAEVPQGAYVVVHLDERPSTGNQGQWVVRGHLRRIRTAQAESCFVGRVLLASDGVPSPDVVSISVLGEFA